MNLQFAEIWTPINTGKKMTAKNKDQVSESRRSFMKNAGKLAAYTPPAMVALMQPSNVAFARSGGFGNGFSKSIKDGFSFSIKELKVKPPKNGFSRSIKDGFSKSIKD